MTPPVQITLIVCITILLIIFGLAAIQLLEKLGNKKHQDNDTEELPDDLPRM